MPAPIVGLGLAGVGAADYAIFRWSGHDYLRWYVASGPLIQLVVAAVAFAVDLERHPLLVSANPGEFVAEIEAVAGVTFLGLSGDLRRPPGSTDDAGVPTTTFLDVLLAAPIYVALAAAFLAWLVVIAPLQYAGNVVAGAPVRLALAAPSRTHLSTHGSQAMITSRPAPAGVADDPGIVSLARKPVTATASISAGLLLALGALT